MVSTFSTPVIQPLVTTKVVDYTTHKALLHTIRVEVFVNEQSIPAQVELDQNDCISHHVLACYDGRPVGTGRLTPVGRIGRVAVSQPLRRRGVGFCIIQKLLEVAKHQNHQDVFLAAQYHAVSFYEKLGFYREGDVFIDVGIPHIMMRKVLHDNQTFHT